MKAHGDTICQRDGTHLDGGIADDKYWQGLHRRTAASMLPLYTPPSGPIENEFILTYTQLLCDIRERRCNSKKTLNFAPCILRKARNKKAYAKTKPLIKGQLAAWKAGQYLALVIEIEDDAQEDGWGTPHYQKFELDSAGRKYDAMVKDGRIKSAAKIVTTRDLGELY